MKRINDSVSGKLRLPDNAIVIDAENLHFLPLFTKRRMELLRLIRTEQATTVSALANALGRKKSAISRDLHILEGGALVTRERNGKTVRAQAETDYIVVALP